MKVRIANQFLFVLLKLGPINELFCSVLESRHLVRQKVRLDAIIDPVSRGEGRIYCPSGLSVWMKVATTCLSSSWLPWLCCCMSFSVVFYCLLDLHFQLCCRDGTWTEHSQINPELHTTFSGFLRGRLLLATSMLATPYRVPPEVWWMHKQNILHPYKVIKLGVMVNDSSPSTWGTEAGGLGVEGHPQLQSELQTNLGYMRLSHVAGEGANARG